MFTGVHAAVSAAEFGLASAGFGRGTGGSSGVIGCGRSKAPIAAIGETIAPPMMRGKRGWEKKLSKEKKAISAPLGGAVSCKLLCLIAQSKHVACHASCISS